MKKRWEAEMVPPGVPKICKHKISQLQKIKQLKRNMVCKYKFVLMNNEYNLYFNFFYKRIPSNSIFFELDSNERSSWLWLEDGLNGLHNNSLALSLLEIYCSSSLQMWRLIGWNSSGLWRLDLLSFKDLGLLKFMVAF